MNTDTIHSSDKQSPQPSVTQSARAADGLLSMRQIVVVDMRGANKSFRAIGGEIGCTAARARQIYLDAVEIMKCADPEHREHPRYGLSRKAQQVCRGMDLNSRDLIREAVLSGQLRPETGSGYGQVTHEEICNWLGLTREQRIAAEQQRDVYCGLTTRARGACAKLGLDTRQKILEAVADGSLSPENLMLRGYGWKTHREVGAWLGLVNANPQHGTICPTCGARA